MIPVLPFQANSLLLLHRDLPFLQDYRSSAIYARFSGTECRLRDARHRCSHGQLQVILFSGLPELPWHLLTTFLKFCFLFFRLRFNILAGLHTSICRFCCISRNEPCVTDLLDAGDTSLRAKDRNTPMWQIPFFAGFDCWDVIHCKYSFHWSLLNAIFI